MTEEKAILNLNRENKIEDRCRMCGGAIELEEPLTKGDNQMTEEKALDAVLNDKPIDEIWLDVILARAEGLFILWDDESREGAQFSVWEDGPYQEDKIDANFLWPIVMRNKNIRIAIKEHLQLNMDDIELTDIKRMIIVEHERTTN